MKKYNKTKSNVNENIVDDQTRMIQKDEVKQKKSSLPPKNKKDKKNKKTKEKTYVSVILSFVQSILYIGFIVGVSYFLAINIVKIANDVFAFKKDESVNYTITLNQYSNIDTIANELEENNIIEYANVFKLYSKLRKDNGKFLTGSIALNAGMDYDTIRDNLKYETVEVKDVRITIPEGFTINQIIDLLVANGIGEKDKYIDVINNYDFEFDFLPAKESLDPNRDYRLEGYLFPDTYDFAPKESEVEVINKFLRNFKVKFEQQYYARAKKLNMSIDEVITLASIVEKEAKIATDYELIASVFHNRLNSTAFPRLESDATINYFLDKPTTDITQEMLDMNNPYNTYRIKGLPPGPICNPGYEAIAYSFYPESTKYYYFVSQYDGTTYYSTNYAQHQKNIAKVKKFNDSYKNSDN